MEKKIGFTTIFAGNEELDLFFNNFALGEVEKDLGKGIPAILRGYDESGSSGLREVSILIQHGANEARRITRNPGKRLSYVEASRVLDRFGFTNVVGPIFEAVAAVITYNPNDTTGEDEELEELSGDEKNG